MKKYLIMLDVNQTLLDTNYHSTSPTINSVIKQLQDEGHVFVINSNRSLEDLLDIARIFEIKGPIIGENGSFIYYQDSGKTIELTTPEVRDQIDNFKEIIPILLEKNFPNSKFIIDDSTTLNKNQDTIQLPGDIIHFFVLNLYRKYTISLHAKKREGDKIVNDLPSTEKIYKLLKEYIENNKLDFIDTYNKDFCNILINPTCTDKGKAYNLLAKDFENYTKIIIADDLIDKALLNEMNYFFAVNNAEDEVKEVANYVSPENITKGVEEILLKINDLAK